MDTKLEEQAKLSVRNAILCAEKMGVKNVAGFAGRIVGKPLEDSLPKFKEIWSEHARFAEDYGIKIAFEGCPMGKFHTPADGINCFTGPEMYERCLNTVESETLGLEYDPSHLICIFADPIFAIKKFGSRIYHVHAKGAKVCQHIIDQYGFWHPGPIEHCFPGFGDEDWGQIIKELRRAGYHGDLNIEGWHDAVFRSRKDAAGAPIEPALEDAGLIIAKNHLKQFCPDGF